MTTTMVERWNRALLEINEWAAAVDSMRSKFTELERTVGTRFHKVLAALEARALLHGEPKTSNTDPFDYYRRILLHPFQVFLVEHNWAAAFRDSEDYSGLEHLPNQWDFRTPYPDCCFELTVCGRR